MTSPAVFAVGVVTTVIGGIGLSVQTGVNSTLGRHVGRGFASVVSFIVGLILLTLFYIVDTYAGKTPAPTLEQMKEVPWWGWTGGLQGAWYVLNVIILAAPLGAATLTSLNVTASLASALLLDATGWIGYPRRSLEWQRVLGLALMVVGVVLVSTFRGQVLDGLQAAEPELPQARRSLQADLHEGLELSGSGVGGAAAAVPK